VRVGVISVGSRTIRLLVARSTQDSVVPLCRERALVGLGEEIIRSGTISDAHLHHLAEHVGEFARLARAMGVTRLEAVLTAPGRDAANAATLAATVGHAAAAATSALSGEDVAVYAFSGALLGSPMTLDPVAVCDIGATSTAVAIGTRDGGPAYVKEIPFGSLSLGAELRERAGAAELTAAREVVEASFGRLLVPLPKTAYVTGGAGRSLRKLAGRTLDSDAIESALRVARRCSSEEIARIHGLAPHRAETLAADALIVHELQRRLAIELDVSGTGHREGFAAKLGVDLIEAA
jgi:exopolyphosphatase/guanosine-5'-triphosphate,3'-diphosphate pyrophosphatase